MKDFNFYAPTRVVFGRESEERLPQLIQQYGGGRVLVHYGGGSARRSGLLDKVENPVWLFLQNVHLNFRYNVH